MRCADGRFAAIHVRPDRFGGFIGWAREVGVEPPLGIDDWDAAAYDAPRARYELVRKTVEAIAARQPRDAFTASAIAARQMCLPVVTLPELEALEQFRTNRQFVAQGSGTSETLPFPRSPVDGETEPVAIGAAPKLGEHTAEVLGELGQPPENVEQLRNDGVI